MVKERLSLGGRQLADKTHSDDHRNARSLTFTPAEIQQEQWLEARRASRTMHELLRAEAAGGAATGAAPAPSPMRARRVLANAENRLQATPSKKGSAAGVGVPASVKKPINTQGALTDETSVPAIAPLSAR
jgi:hypothetical protein